MNSEKPRGKKMSSSFHNNVPSWIIKYLAAAACSRCGSKIKKTDITAMGVREHDQKTVPYVEYTCKCSHRAMKSFSDQFKGTIEEVCYMLLEESQNKKRIKQSQLSENKNNNSSEMTEEEVAKFIKQLHEYENYNDLLKEIGAIEWLESEDKNES